MRWVDREAELERLTALAGLTEGGLAVVYGRRRIGKTRLLLEWVARTSGLYTVADHSTAEVQRRYFAQRVAEVLDGFDQVLYPDWQTLLTHLARQARESSWRGPLIIDELPYLVSSSPELPSVLQRFIDHDAARTGLALGVAGSSQRMMQGLVLSPDAPLYGRAREVIELGPLPTRFIGEAFGLRSVRAVVERYTALGGVPRYWELAIDAKGALFDRLDRLVLDRLGPLHREPDRLLLEELPPAIELRPILDAIGAGAHRVSEIAGRMGHKATSLARPLDRLVGMGLVRRETPFGEPERSGKRSLYRISDPFFRLWFRVVAPHRGLLADARPSVRRQLLARYWDGLIGSAWEELCRSCLPALAEWGPASRWWHGNAPEWDIVAESLDGQSLLYGEARWHDRAMTLQKIKREAHRLNERPLPQLPSRFGAHRPLRALFIPTCSASVGASVDGVRIITGADLLTH